MNLQNTSRQPANLLFIYKSHQVTQLNQINIKQRIVHHLLAKLKNIGDPSALLRHPKASC